MKTRGVKWRNEPPNSVLDLHQPAERVHERWKTLDAVESANAVFVELSVTGGWFGSPWAVSVTTNGDLPFSGGGTPRLVPFRPCPAAERRCRASCLSRSCGRGRVSRRPG